MSAARPDTWMPIYWGDYLRDTMHLRAEGHGAYLMIIAHYWTNGEPLPDDDEYLSTVVRVERRAWRRLRPTLERFFQIEDGLWRHKRIDVELGRADRITTARQQAGKRGGKRSAAARAKATKSEANQQANEKQTGRQNPTQSQPPPQEEDPSLRSGRARPKPGLADLDPEEFRELAEAEGRDPVRELANFRDWCAKKGKTFKDYRAAFRHWLRSEYGRGPPAEANGAKATEARLRRHFEQMERDDGPEETRGGEVLSLPNAAGLRRP